MEGTIGLVAGVGPHASALVRHVKHVSKGAQGIVSGVASNLGGTNSGIIMASSWMGLGSPV